MARINPWRDTLAVSNLKNFNKTTFIHDADATLLDLEVEEAMTSLFIDVILVFLDPVDGVLLDLPTISDVREIDNITIHQLL